MNSKVKRTKTKPLFEVTWFVRCMSIYGSLRGVYNSRRRYAFTEAEVTFHDSHAWYLYIYTQYDLKFCDFHVQYD